MTQGMTALLNHFKQTVFDRRRGDIYALLLSMLEGFFPVFSLVTVAAYGALHAYFYTILLATFVLLVLAWRRGEISALFDYEARRDLLLTSLFITSLFVLVFISLRYTSAGNVAVILVLQLLFSYVYFNVIGQERLSVLHSLGAALMGIGAVIVLFPQNFSVNIGDGLALVAAAIAPVANHYQQRARRRVSSFVVLAFRNTVALPVLFALAMFFEPSRGLFSDKRALLWLLGNALLVFVGAKILWVEALHHISITRLSAMAAFIPVFTLLFAWWLLGEIPQPRQIVGVLPVIIGAWFMTRNSSVQSKGYT